jgi:hypothetical protein
MNSTYEDSCDENSVTYEENTSHEDSSGEHSAFDDNTSHEDSSDENSAPSDENSV